MPAYISIAHLADFSPRPWHQTPCVQHQSWPGDEAGQRLIMISFVMLIMSVSNLMMGRDKSTSKYFTSTRGWNTGSLSRVPAATSSSQLDSICRHQPGPCQVNTLGLSSDLEGKLAENQTTFHPQYSMFSLFVQIRCTSMAGSGFLLLFLQIPACI